MTPEEKQKVERLINDFLSRTPEEWKKIDEDESLSNNIFDELQEISDLLEQSAEYKRWVRETVTREKKIRRAVARYVKGVYRLTYYRWKRSEESPYRILNKKRITVGITQRGKTKPWCVPMRSFPIEIRMKLKCERKRWIR